MKINVPLELAEIAGEPVEADVPDEFSKFLETAAVAGAYGGRPGTGFAHIEALREETAQLDKSVASRYKAIAEKVTKKLVASAGGDDPHKLEKRFSPDEKAGYRQFFKEHLEKGKTAAEILNGWLVEFPHHHPDIGKLMREVAAEFA
jgi:hypothetical protein